MMRDPDETEVALGIAADPWIEGLEEGAWSRKQNETVAAVLAAGSFPLAPDHPEFPEARDKIARAFVWANRALASRFAASGASRHLIPSSPHPFHPRHAMALGSPSVTLLPAMRPIRGVGGRERRGTAIS
jgi:hypothetical protein